MKASEYARMFDVFPTIQDVKGDAFAVVIKKLLDGLLDEVLAVARSNSPSAIKAEILEVNRKFRVIRGMLKTKYGQSILKYDGFAMFVTHNFQDVMDDIGLTKEELLK